MVRHGGTARGGVYRCHAALFGGTPPRPTRGHGRRQSRGVAAMAPGEVIASVLDGLGLPYEHPEPDAYLVKLQGTHKLATMTWLAAGQHSLQVEAFFCRQPDENHADFYRFLLTRNARMYGVHFALDKIGDVYLTGRLPLVSVTEDELDRLLGCVLAYSD